MELLNIREHLRSLPVTLVGSVLLTFLVFCVVLLCVFTFWVPGCDIRYNFLLKTMFGSSLPPFVCRSAHVLFTLFVFVCVLWRPTHIVLWFCFVFLGFVYPTLDCPFWLPLRYSLTFIYALDSFLEWPSLGMPIIKRIGSQII